MGTVTDVDTDMDVDTRIRTHTRTRTRTRMIRIMEGIIVRPPLRFTVPSWV
jgi:hypothetical protein